MIVSSFLVGFGGRSRTVWLACNNLAPLHFSGKYIPYAHIHYTYVPMHNLHSGQFYDHCILVVILEGFHHVILLRTVIVHVVPHPACPVLLINVEACMFNGVIPCTVCMPVYPHPNCFWSKGRVGRDFVCFS